MNSVTLTGMHCLTAQNQKLDGKNIPLDIREVESITEFKWKLSTYMWNKITEFESDSETES